MKKLIQKILYGLAKLTLARYRPRVIAVTGSVGKTSTTGAIVKVLETKFSVRGSAGNYNNEFGVPLTIINEKSGGRNLLLWILIIIKAVLKLIYADYPQVLVLELGADRPGDIGYLAGMLGRIEIGVLTDIGISHLEFFSSQSELAKEKWTLIKKLDRSALAILNFDNPKIFEYRTQAKADVWGYGFNPSAQIMISDFQIIRVNDKWGVNFKIHHNGNVVPYFLPDALGKPPVYAAAAAVGCAVRFGIDLATASEILKSFSPPPGRLRMLSGIKNTLIIDDTYNAAPDSTFAALEALSQISSGRKVIAFGGMTELGNKTESGHREVAGKIMENNIDLVFLVGENARIVEHELRKRKFGGQVKWFETADQARIPIQDELREQDTILVKGSQAGRMEKIVKEIMDEPLRAEELLVRQSQKWLATP
ncbi:MAG: UDP-N-acetylmuramoyl-tripeptide--D-alanyl-D-alanine ligase [Candidatus Doudnabacteria bacterium]